METINHNVEQKESIHNEQQTGEGQSRVEPLISKKQLKKQKRYERWLEARPERRRIEREKRKLKRKAVAQEKADKGDDFVQAKRYLMGTSNNKFKIVIDLDYEEFMTDKEISKSVQQVARIYSSNRHASNPCQLYLTSLKDKILERFVIMNRGYLKWDINYSEKSYLNLFNDDTKSEEQNIDQFIYLTADSEDTLPNVDELLNDYQSKIFVIGGLVDHNRHKNLCFNLATKRGIKTAKLPISHHVKLNQRQVLSTVTVFDILLEVFGSRKPWEDALKSMIPKRKIADSQSLKQDIEIGTGKP